MIRFVYPNVNERFQFAGCGRFLTTIPSDPLLKSSYHLANPNVGHLSKITTAAAFFARDSFETEQEVYECQDDPMTYYCGDSMGLAYLLSLIKRSRPLRWGDLNGFPFDIWCTGTIEIYGEKPYVGNVYQNLFDKKLEAFLQDPHDMMFIVPVANLKPAHTDLFDAYNVVVCTPDLLQTCSLQNMRQGKIIIKVHGDELERLVENIFLPSSRSLKNAKLITNIHPYRGLFTFQEKDSPFFFGRETYIRRLDEMVHTQSFITIIGASGSGKSSLVYAGLLPKLRQEGNWKIVSFRPGNQPGKNLLKALSPLLYEDDVDLSDKIHELSQQLAQNTINVQHLLASIFEKIETNGNFLLFIDQYEEIYTNQHDKACCRFLCDLLNIFANSAYSGHLLLTMRADFLGKALAYRPFADVLAEGIVVLGPMNHQELKHAIEQPARICGASIEEGLTERLLEAVAGEAGNLPLLEFTLARLWEEQTQGILTHAAYDHIEGIDNALTSYAEEVYHKLSCEEQAQVQQIFTQLVCPGEGTEDTRRTATRADIGEKNWPLVIKLANSRLVVTDCISFSGISSTDSLITETVEVVHEALLGQWQRLQGWIDRDREFRIWQERLRAAMHQWHKSRFDDGALLRGLPLTEAESWLKQQSQEISQNEQNFIRTSLILRDRERLYQEEQHQRELDTTKQLHEEAIQRERIQRTFTYILLGLFVVILGITIAMFFLWKNAEVQRQLAEHKTLEALSVSAKTLFLSYDELGALLAIIKAGKILQHSQIAGELHELIRANFQMIVENMYEKNRLETHSFPIFTISLNTDGTRLVSGNGDGTVNVWNLENSRLIQTFQGHTGSVLSVAFCPFAPLVASGSSDNTIKIWDLVHDKETASLHGHTGFVYSVAFSPDGKILASASQDRQIKLWDVETFRESMTLQGHQEAVSCVRFSPDGKILASASDDRTIKFWNAHTGDHIRTLQGHSDFIFSLAFSPNNTLLASASQDRTIRLWNVSTGKEIASLQGHEDFVSSLCFDPEGLRLVSASKDKSIKVWSLQNYAEIQTLWGHTRAVFAVNFSPDGKNIVSASEDGTIRIWDFSQKMLTSTAGLEELLFSGCRWIQSYLQTNPHLKKEDRFVCSDIQPGTEEK